MNKRDEKLQRIHDHGVRLLKLFPNATDRNPISLSKRAYRLERQLHSLQEEDCNGNPDADTEEKYNAWQSRIEHDENNAKKRFQLLFGVPLENPFFVNGDPRGYSLKVDRNYMREHNIDLPRDWGGYGLIAPDLTEGS